jgi:hypothetical protein
VKNYVLCLNELSDVVIETEGLIHDFIDVVNNGKIKPEIPSSARRYPTVADATTWDRATATTSWTAIPV